MYLDPGFGGMLLQGLVATAAVGGAILFSLRKKIKGLFSKKADTAENDNTLTSVAPLAEDDVVDMLDEK